MTSGHTRSIGTVLGLVLGLALWVGGSAMAQEPPASPYKTTRYGFIRDWLKLGPIVYGQQRGDPMQQHPINYEKLKKDALEDPTYKDYIGDGWKAAPKPGDKVGELAWQEFHPQADRINLDRGKDYELNYLVAYLWSPRDIQGGAIYCGSDDFIELFVNGLCVHVWKKERRGLLPGDEVLHVDLHKGWNVINAKVVDVTSGYEFYLCVVDDTGTPMAEAPVTLAAPEGLMFCSPAEAAASKEKMHELGQEKVPAAKAFFDPAEAVGAKYPIAIEFTQDGSLAPTDKDQPLAYAVAGQDKPIHVRYTVRSTDASSAKAYKVVAQLLQRDARQGGDDPLQDKVLKAQQVQPNLTDKPFEGQAFEVPTDQVGYFAVEVSVYDGDKRVRFDDYPVAVITRADYKPVKFDQPLEMPTAWQEGDFARWKDVTANHAVESKLKFWPVLDYPTDELVSPIAPNMLERGGAANGGLGTSRPRPCPPRPARPSSGATGRKTPACTPSRPTASRTRWTTPSAAPSRPPG